MRSSLPRRARRTAQLAAGLALFFGVPLAQAWDAVGHRAITWLALDGLDKSAPDWLRDAAVRHSIAWEASEPDRWRSAKNPYIMNSTYMDHFIDLEDLEALGLTPDTVPQLRYRYVQDMAVARHEHPTGPMGDAKPYNAKLDPTGQSEWPGFILHAMVEQQARLAAQFKIYRILARLNEESRKPQLEMAKANIMVTMGILAHWVGDGAQPLHTTRHHHGWVGDNPKGYTTDKGIHSYIDGGVLAHFKLDYNSLKDTQKFEAKVDQRDPWNDVMTYVKRSHDCVEPLYQLEKSGELKKEKGKAFISERLHDAGAMLAAMYNAAWATSEPSDADIADFVKYDGFDAKQLPQSASAAPAQPAPLPKPVK